MSHRSDTNGFRDTDGDVISSRIDPTSAPHGLRAVIPVTHEVGDAGEDSPRVVNPVRLIARTLRGRWRIAALLALLFSVVGAAAGFHLKGPVYVSGGIIQVFPNKTNILYSDRDDSRLRLFDAFVSAELSYLQSTPVLERAITFPALERIGWPADVEGVARLRKTLEVEKKGGLITITAGYHLADDAAAIVNSVLDAYGSLHAEQLKLQDTVRERELTQREHEMLTRLRDFDTQILATGKEYGTGSIATAHTRKIAQAEEVDQRISDLAMTIVTKEAAESANNVDIGDSEIKRLLVLDHAMADMLFERSKLAGELAVLETQHASEHHTVIEARARLKVTEEAIEDRRNQLSTLGTSGALTKSATNEKGESIDDLKALRERFVARRDDLQQEARELNGRLIQLEFLRKERDETRMLLDETRRALEQVRVESRHSLPGTIEIKSRGSVPTRPATDKRVAFAAAGGVFGAAGGIAMTVVFGFAFRRYRFSDELDHGFPEVATIGALPACQGDRPETNPEYIRAIHRLRVDLQLQSSARADAHILAVTGTQQGAGSSTIAKALAEAFAGARLRTVLVDADFTDSDITHRLGLCSAAGVREALLDGHLNGQLPEVKPGMLQTLPVGAAQQLPDSHVSHRLLAGLLQQLRTRCDLVIVDLGPLPDRLTARLGAALADHVLCVVPAGSGAEVADPPLNELARLAPRRTSTVLNRALPDDPLLAAICRKNVSSRGRIPKSAA